MFEPGGTVQNPKRSIAMTIELETDREKRWNKTLIERAKELAKDRMDRENERRRLVADLINAERRQCDLLERELYTLRRMVKDKETSGGFDRRNDSPKMEEQLKLSALNF